MRKQVPGLSCRCFLPRAAGCGAHIPCEGKQPFQVLSWHIWRGVGIQAAQPGITGQNPTAAGSPARHGAAPGCGEPISRQDRALGRGGKAGEGKCFIRNTALGFVNNSGFTPSLQKAAQRKSWGKGSTEVAQQARAKSGYFGSIRAKVLVREHFSSSWLEKGWI